MHAPGDPLWAAAACCCCHRDAAAGRPFQARRSTDSLSTLTASSLPPARALLPALPPLARSGTKRRVDASSPGDVCSLCDVGRKEIILSRSEAGTLCVGQMPDGRDSARIPTVVSPHEHVGKRPLLGPARVPIPVPLRCKECPDALRWLRYVSLAAGTV